MSLADDRLAIERRIEPARLGLGRVRANLAFRYGLTAGVRMLPVLAVIAALGYLGATYVGDGAPFSPWLLPLVLVVVPAGAAFALWLQTRRLGVPARAAALVLDRNLDTRDRISAALDLAARDDSDGGDRRAAMARLAIADGAAAAAAADLARIDVPRPAFGRPSRAAIALALLIALAPAILDLAGAGTPAAPDAATPIAARDAEAERSTPQGDDATGETDAAAEPPPRAAPTPRHERPRAPRAATPEAEPERADPERPDERRRGGGQGDAGADASDAAGQRTPAGGDSQSSASGASQGGGQGGGGQGRSESEAEPQDPRADAPRKRDAAKRPNRPSETEAEDAEPSAGTPSGPSRGGGKMAAVGNQRQGFDRGADRDEDVETDEEEIEDEKEESEQRGGVMPMTRDRMQAATRELSISGNGPPDDGRGGPTPPKKSRGTASLVLGVRLPDQVRGQPNPGTAKTTLERIPPVPQQGPARPATAAESPGPSPHRQSRAPDAGAFDAVVRRYHELLRDPGSDRAPRGTESSDTHD